MYRKREYSRVINKTLFFLTLLLSSCRVSHFKTNGSELSEIKPVSNFEKVFSEIDSLLDTDHGEFWGYNLYGPIILVHPETRVFYSNEINDERDFQKNSSIYTDTLPKELNIANTSFEWQGKRWSMILLPLPAQKFSRNNLIIHELYHRIQPRLGFQNISEGDNSHLDGYEGRLLLRLELKALEKALNANDFSEQKKHIRNALIFRSKRQSSQKIKENENLLELNEGMAEFTSLMLNGSTTGNKKLYLLKSLNEFYRNPTFVRTFAYQTIPIYGFLLTNKKPLWHREITSATNLTDFFVRNFDVKINSVNSIEAIAVQNRSSMKELKKRN